MWASEFEGIKQCWDAGKTSGICISVDIIVERCQDITQKHINAYLKEWYDA